MTESNESNESNGLRLTNYDVVSWKVASKGRVFNAMRWKGYIHPYYLLVVLLYCII